MASSTCPRVLCLALLQLSIGIGVAEARSKTPGNDEGKMVVYNLVSRHPNPERHAALHKIYDSRFRVVDIGKENKAFVDEKDLDCPIPARPRDASNHIVTGHVRILCVVSADGRMLAPAVVESSSNVAFDAAVMSQMKDWRFTPATLNGKPVASIGGLNYISEKQRLPSPSVFKDSSAIDAQGVKRTVRDYPDGGAVWMEDVIKRVVPEYHHTAGTGSGVFRVLLDSKTGAVTKVIVVRSTGLSLLDNSARESLIQWRWRPGKWRMVDIPFSFGASSPENGFGTGEIGPPISIPPRGIVP